MRAILFLAPLLALVLPAIAIALPNWHWKGDFSHDERARLKNWVQDAMDAAEQLLGHAIPVDHVHFTAARAREPVPWARTHKGRDRSVYFHVDLRHPASAFRHDWTAPHELVHLVFPYLGHSSRWFAEGIASYLQYQVMYAGGVLEWDEAIARYANRFAAAGVQGSDPRRSIPQLSQERGHSAYVRLYWGGAAFFLHADRQLFETQGQRLTDLVRQYHQCCYRRWGVDAEEMIRTFDRLSGSRVFATAYENTVARPGFPETESALRWLATHPPRLAQR